MALFSEMSGASIDLGVRLKFKAGLDCSSNGLFPTTIEPYSFPTELRVYSYQYRAAPSRREIPEFKGSP